MHAVLSAGNTAIRPDADLIKRFDKPGPRYTSYPSADRFHSDFQESDYRAQLQARGRRVLAQDAGPLSVYVHIPFCSSLCYYCACNKVVTRHPERAATYLEYLFKELQLVQQHMACGLGQELPPQAMSQLHLGGGTPTFLNHAQLQSLMQTLRQYFVLTPDAELGIEIDPRSVTPESMAGLADLGFNRTSLGVQDFDPAVQQAIHRIQPVEMVADTLHAARAAGFSSINFDLIYGLPKQTLASFDTTISQVLALNPDRIALYNYAHLPHRFKSQRRILVQDLPSAEERLDIFLLAMQRLLAAGYVYIGLDHFARPEDSLAQALRDGSLQRNFQGYTTQAECDLLGLGVSAIGKLGNSYSQSLRTLEDYYASLDAGHLPLEKGFVLCQDDALRREIIMQVMCGNTLDFAEIERAYPIRFADYFASELARLQEFAALDLISLDAQRLQLKPQGRMFVRAIGMVFDQFLGRATQASYSKLI